MRIDKNCLACADIDDCVYRLDCSNHRHFRVAEPVYAMGDRPDGIWQVLEGLVALRSYTERGGVALVRLVQVGGVFGYRSYLIGEPRSTSAQALTGCRLKHVPGAMLDRMLQRAPRLGQALQVAMAEAYRDAQTRILDMSTQNARTRFLGFCAWLARNQGVDPAPEGYALTLPITHQEIALVLAISPETLSRGLRRMIDEGVVAFPEKYRIDIAAGWHRHCPD